MATEMDASEVKRTGDELLDQTVTGGDGVVVDEAAVPDGAIQHLNLGAEGHPRRVFFRSGHKFTMVEESKALMPNDLGL